MQHRCPGSSLLSVGSLPDYKLAFTAFSKTWNAGVADVVMADGERVWGLVYALSEADLSALDEWEGYPEQYTRFLGSIETPAGSIEAWLYTVSNKKEIVAPSRQYLEIIRQAALRHGFPEAYVRMLAEVEITE